MNATTSFELLSTSNEFENASEEFERSYRGGRSGSARYGASQRRRPPSPSLQRRPAPPAYGFGLSNVGTVWPDWGGQGSNYQRCMAQCLAAPYPPPYAPPDAPPYGSPYGSPPDAAPFPADPGPGPDSDAPSEEMNMHPYRCLCQQCAGANEAFESTVQGEGEGEFGNEYESEGETQWAAKAGSAFSEAEEIALAAELLSVSSEAELEQFLGGLWKKVKKVAGTVGQIAKPFSGILKAVAKKALPFVGGALGSLIPIPGVGTALGTALGKAVSSALEMEFEGMELEDREFEMARRFVRIAGSAAQQAADGAAPAEFEAALAAAAQQHLPHFGPGGMPGQRQGRMGGTWTRRGTTLVLHGA